MSKETNFQLLVEYFLGCKKCNTNKTLKLYSYKVRKVLTFWCQTKQQIKLTNVCLDNVLKSISGVAVPFILGPSLLPEPNATAVILNKTLGEDNYDYKSYLRFCYSVIVLSPAN